MRIARLGLNSSIGNKNFSLQVSGLDAQRSTMAAVLHHGTTPVASRRIMPHLPPVVSLLRATATTTEESIRRMQRGTRAAFTTLSPRRFFSIFTVPEIVIQFVSQFHSPRNNEPLLFRPAAAINLHPWFVNKDLKGCELSTF